MHFLDSKLLILVLMLILFQLLMAPTVIEFFRKNQFCMMV